MGEENLTHSKVDRFTRTKNNDSVEWVVSPSTPKPSPVTDSYQPGKLTTPDLINLENKESRL